MTMKMKRYAFVAAVLMTVSCNNALNPVLENAFYISEASSGNYTKVILNETDGADVSATVRCGKKLDNEVTVRLELSQEALDSYNKRNGTSLVMLPESAHDFRACTVTVPAGSSLAEMVTVHVKPYTDELINSGKKYALPLCITEVSADIPLLEMKKCMIYAFEQVIVTSGFQINPMSGTKKVLKNPINTNTYTVELRVAPRGLGKENEAFLMIYPDQTNVNEGQGQVYCRFQVDNSINIKVLSNENYTWPGPVTTKWYHLALVSTGDGTIITYINGAEVMRESKPAYANNNLMEVMYLGSDSQQYHTNAYCYSEVRLWSVARSQSQIADNMYSVDPASDNLVVYWKCDEGEGTILHDATGNGNDIDLETNVLTNLTGTSETWKWIAPVRSDRDDLLDI